MKTTFAAAAFAAFAALSAPAFAQSPVANDADQKAAIQAMLTNVTFDLKQQQDAMTLLLNARIDERLAADADKIQNPFNETGVNAFVLADGSQS